jgi:predicted 2-oxoglutarate/Fe(II)-dependent dioxygenase YbiX
MSGCTSTVTVRHAGVNRAARAIAYRSQGLHRGRPTTFRSATISCCRSYVRRKVGAAPKALALAVHVAIVSARRSITEEERILRFKRYP